MLAERKLERLINASKVIVIRVAWFRRAFMTILPFLPTFKLDTPIFGSLWSSYGDGSQWFFVDRCKPALRDLVYISIVYEQRQLEQILVDCHSVKKTQNGTAKTCLFHVETNGCEESDRPNSSNQKRQ
jgi:hypothetical protein